MTKDLLMSASMRGFRGKNSSSSVRLPSDLPENLGNRKTFEETRIPPDNVGNMIEQDPIATFIHDGLGNSVDEEPSHLKSGILTHLLGVRDRNQSRKPHRDYNSTRGQISEARGAAPTLLKESAPDTDPEEYMKLLIKEFAKLLSKKMGLPFSFSMNTIKDPAVDETAEQENLLSIKALIEEILAKTAINASVAISQYRTVEHRFAVFFVNPKERDPARNKDLISALRQVVSLYVARFSSGQVNVLLVLANAQNVIEEHLSKIGAKKVEA